MLNPGLNRRSVSRSSAIYTIALLLAVTLPTAAFRAAQASPATLTGSVYDSTGAVMPGVAITLENAKEEKQQATTRADGRFDFPHLFQELFHVEGLLRLRQQFVRDRRGFGRIRVVVRFGVHGWLSPVVTLQW